MSKRLKLFLRLAVKKGAKVWRASTDGDYIDTFMRIDRIFQCDTTLLADAMTSYDQVYRDEVDAYKERWEKHCGRLSVMLSIMNHPSAVWLR